MDASDRTTGTRHSDRHTTPRRRRPRHRNENTSHTSGKVSAARARHDIRRSIARQPELAAGSPFSGPTRLLGKHATQRGLSAGADRVWRNGGTLIRGRQREHDESCREGPAAWWDPSSEKGNEHLQGARAMRRTSSISVSFDCSMRRGGYGGLQPSGSSSGHRWAPCRTRRIRIAFSVTI